MRNVEIHSPVIADVDPYLEARREMERLKTARAREWAGLSFDDRTLPEVTWAELDVYRAAAKERLQKEPQLFDDDARFFWQQKEEEVHRAWVEKREAAQLAVRMADKLGEPVPDEMRQLAEEPDRLVALKEARARMVQRRKGALQAVLMGQ